MPSPNSIQKPNNRLGLYTLQETVVDFLCVISRRPDVYRSNRCGPWYASGELASSKDVKPLTIGPGHEKCIAQLSDAERQPFWHAFCYRFFGNPRSDLLPEYTPRDSATTRELLTSLPPPSVIVLICTPRSRGILSASQHLCKTCRP